MIRTFRHVCVTSSKKVLTTASTFPVYFLHPIATPVAFKRCSGNSIGSPFGRVHLYMSSRERETKTEAKYEFIQEPPVPKLPVPPLEQTLQRYLESIEIIVTPEQYAKTKNLVEEFGRSGAEGSKLQERLIEISQQKDNWAYDWWLDDMYLNNRLALPVNSNPFVANPPQNFRNQNDQLWFATRLMSGILDYQEVLYRKELPVDTATGKDKAPLCMAQYYRLFTSYRMPSYPKDILISTFTESAPADAHFIVACRGQFFVLEVKRNSKKISESLIVHQLKRILQMAYEEEENAQCPVGLLTSDHRDNWAQAWKILSKDPKNKASLDLVIQSLGIICLDEPLPLSFNRNQEKQRDKANRALQLLHGGGTNCNGANRWYDKTMQLIVSPDGISGTCMEHSPAEGIVIIQLMERLLAEMGDITTMAREDSVIPNDVKPPKRLHWNCEDPQLQMALKRAAANLDMLVADLDFYILYFTDYGRELPKANRMSPDAFIQVALQLAFYKTHGFPVSTYESAATRRFRLGRVDNIRAAQKDTLNWVKAMVEQNKTTEQEKLDLFKKAIATQTNVMISNVTGYGIDCHLLALRELSKELNQPLPDVFSDETYKLSNYFRLSTSQVPTIDEDSYVGYGAVVPDGYGASYNPHKNSILFCIGSFRSVGDTDSELFAQNLKSSLLQIKDLLCSAKSHH